MDQVAIQTGSMEGDCRRCGASLPPGSDHVCTPPYGAAPWPTASSYTVAVLV